MEVLSVRKQVGKIKIIRTTDYELVASLNKPVHDLHYKIHPDYFKEYDMESMKEFFKGIIDNPDFLFLVIEHENHFVGYAWVEIRTYLESIFKKSYQSMYVHQISVDEINRNQGYGTKLMDEISRVAIENKIHLIELDYWSSNLLAKNFYVKHGFKIYREFVYKKI